MIDSEQIRAARVLLRLGQDDVARRARVSTATIRRLEAENGIRSVSPATVGEIRRVLEDAGAEFIPGGVRRRAPRDASGVEDRFAGIMDIARRGAARPTIDPPFDDGDLYGDDGLPS
ncbi:MAG: helix-turn-helix transcriptional regulator [Magnetospirillum sp.]|nr:helix-turn-helix transcriptional regulator [Magnetospirillum sp.]